MFSYTNCKPAWRHFDFTMISLFKRELGEENQWLASAVKGINRVDHSIDIPISWTEYHTSQSRDKSDDTVTINVLMPVIYAKSNIIDLQYHLMKTAVEYTQTVPKSGSGCSRMLRPTAVCAKKNNSCPAAFGVSYFVFMDGLHIEQAALVSIGQLLKGTGIDSRDGSSFLVRGGGIICQKNILL